MLYKLAFARFVLFSVTTLCGAIMTALAGTDWATATTQTKLLIVLGILSTWCATTMAFLDRTAKQIADGKNPVIPEGGTPIPWTPNSPPR